MTDHLTPENKALVERVLGYGTARTYNRHEIDRIIDAARADGRRSNPFDQPCHDCGSTEILGPICAKCNPEMVAQVEGRRSTGGDHIAEAGKMPPSPSGQVREAVVRAIGGTPVNMNMDIASIIAQASPSADVREVLGDAADAILALIPTRDEAALPERWVAVPREPTEAMISAAGPLYSFAGWSAMLAAAPPPPPPVGGQAGDVVLHPATAKLVSDFSAALAEKLAKAEQKYGHSDGWLDANWEADCREALLKHIEKGDPRDVAAYCAFMWFHRWSTSAAKGQGQ